MRLKHITIARARARNFFKFLIGWFPPFMFLPVFEDHPAGVLRISHPLFPLKRAISPYFIQYLYFIS